MVKIGTGRELLVVRFFKTSKTIKTIRTSRKMIPDIVTVLKS